MSTEQRQEQARRILAALEQAPEVAGHAEHFAVNEHWELVLEGRVDTIEAKRRALRLAREAADTPAILDRVKVAPRGAAPPDGAVEEHVVQALMTEPAFQGIPVNARQPKARHGEHPWVDCFVDQGTVTLKGTVESLSHRRLAEVVAWSAPGCQDVRNLLRVQPPERDTDEEVTDVVRMALEKSPALDAQAIAITTREREVILSGVVQDEAQRRLASERCWSIPGVHEVDNRLTVAG
jgi:osmotically-inducible protein OsmY